MAIYIVLWSCAPKPATVVAGEAKAPGEIVSPMGKEGWEAERERVQKEAKKEGKVILYTTVGSDVRSALAKALKKYDIALESIAGPPVQILEKILRERKAGIHNVDFLQGGLTMHMAMKPEGHLAPLETLLILPEVKEPSV